MAQKSLAHQAGKFVKHVVPAAVKPIHSLWHEVLGCVFLLFAAVATWKVVRNSGALGSVQIAVLALFILVMAGYGISSFVKARRISRS